MKGTRIQFCTELNFPRVLPYSVNIGIMKALNPAEGVSPVPNLTSGKYFWQESYFDAAKYKFLLRQRVI